EVVGGAAAVRRIAAGHGHRVGVAATGLARRAGVPGREEHTEVSTVDGAVTAQVSAATRGAPGSEEITKVGTIDDAVLVEVSAAAAGAAAGEALEDARADEQPPRAGRQAGREARLLAGVGSGERIEDRSERAVRDTAGVDDTDDERELRGRAHGHSGELGELELEPVGVTEAALGPTRAADGHAAVDVLERGREGAEVRA